MSFIVSAIIFEVYFPLKLAKMSLLTFKWIYLNFLELFVSVVIAFDDRFKIYQ